MNEDYKTEMAVSDDEMTYVKKQEYLEMKTRIENLKAQIKYLQERVDHMSGEIDAYRFCIRCNGVSGAEVTG